MVTPRQRNTVQLRRIAGAIVELRGQRVLLDAELAALYGVTTKRLNEQVKRNSGRFPKDFLFRLTSAKASMANRSQIAAGSQRHRDAGIRGPGGPYLGSKASCVKLSYRF